MIRLAATGIVVVTVAVVAGALLVRPDISYEKHAEAKAAIVEIHAGEIPGRRDVIGMRSEICAYERAHWLRDRYGIKVRTDVGQWAFRKLADLNCAASPRSSGTHAPIASAY